MMLPVPIVISMIFGMVISVIIALMIPVPMLLRMIVVMIPPMIVIVMAITILPAFSFFGMMKTVIGYAGETGSAN